MKHYSIKKMLITMLTIFCLCSMWTISTQAAGISKLCNYTEKNLTFKRDITGDGKIDTIKLKLVKDRYHALDKVNIFINGKKSGSLDCNNSYGISVNYISMSKKNVFLQIYSLGPNDYVEANSIFKYNKKTKKLDNVLDFQKVAGGGSMDAHDVTSVSGSQIKVFYTGQPCETGRIECTYTFVFKNGKFKLKSNTTSVKSLFTKYVVNDKYGKYLAKHQFVAEKNLNFYKNSNLSKVSFTAKKGDILTLKKIKIAGGKTYLQFKKGAKTGWVKVYNDYPSVYPDNEHGWFCGILYRLAG